MNMRIIVGRLATLAAASTLAACATMTVDVDVYKGPLDNHESVQIEQMAVMAVGAKPLLVELRDKLAAGDLINERTMSYSCPWKAGYMRPAQAVGRCFRDPDAERVNAILSLYENQDNSEVGRHVANAENAIGRYGEYFSRLTRFPEGDDPASWESISRGMVTVSGDAPCVFPAGHPFHALSGDDKKSACFWVGELKSGYREFFNPTTRFFRWDKPFSDRSCDRGGYDKHKRWNACRISVSSGKLNELCKSEGSSCSSYDVSGELLRLDKGVLTANAAYDVLSSTRFVERYSEFLFNEDGASKSAQRGFVSEVVEISKSYIDARSSMSEALNELLWALAIWDDVVLEKSAISEDQRHQLAAYVKYHLLNEKALRGKEIGAEFGNLRNSLDRIGSQALVDGAWVTLSADRKLRSIGVANPNYRFGLAKGPIEDLAVTTPQLLGSGLARISRGMASGLERGRASRGIESLIEAYLDSSNRTVGDPGFSNGSRERLIDALVRFAEKIRFIADNGVLLNGESDGTTSDATVDRAIDPYTAILQAVSNSIIVMANEARHRRDGKLKSTLAIGVENELEGMRSAGVRNPVGEANAIVEDFEIRLADLVANVGEAEAKAEAIDEQLAPLEEEVSQREAARKKAEENHASARGVWVKLLLKQLFDATKAEEELYPGSGIPGTIAEAVKNRLPQEGPVSYSKYREELRGLLSSAFDKVSGSDAEDTAEKQAALRTMGKWLGDFPDDWGDGESNREGISPKIQDKVDKAIKGIDITSGVKAAVKTARAAEREAATKLASAEGAVKESRKKRDAVVEKKTTLTAESGKLNGQRQTMDAMVKELKKARLAVVAGYGGTTTVGNGVERMRGALLRNLAAVATGNDKPIRDALEELEAYAGTRVNLPSTTGMEAEKPAEVLDRMIAALRYQHVAALAEQSPSAASIGKALDAAVSHRANMIYIRPSSAYLRSSYPSSLLQGDPGVGWNNMLGDQGVRGIPFFGEHLVNAPRKNRLKIMGEVDRQFWQNINRVRVSGGGDTTYVVTKDDIGNWYVKSFSATPTQIIESARSLALFNLGPALNADLIGRYSARHESGAAATTVEPKLAQLFRRHTTQYSEDLEGVRTEAEGMFTPAMLSDTVRGAWSGSGLEEHLVARLNELAGEVTTALSGQSDTATVAERAGDREEIIAGGRANSEALSKAISGAVGFYAKLADRIAEIETVPAPPSEGEGDAAARDEAIAEAERAGAAAGAAAGAESGARAGSEAAVANASNGASGQAAMEAAAEAGRQAGAESGAASGAAAGTTAGADAARAALAEAEGGGTEETSQRAVEEDEKAKAKRIAAGAIRARVDAVLAKVSQSIDEYQRSLTFILEANADSRVGLLREPEASPSPSPDSGLD